MPRNHPPHSPEFRQQMVQLVRAGRTPNELAREFELTAESIRNWVKQAEIDEGPRSDGPTTDEKQELGQADTSKGEAIVDLVLEVAQYFFRFRAIGQKTGLITSWGGGAFGFMRSLALLGPLTVPQIAQMRPTSRQRMQRLADELAAEGLVELVDNPRHRRSKLVRLTRKGQARYRKLSARFLAIASTMATDLSEADIRKTVEIVRRLSDEAKGRL